MGCIWNYYCPSRKNVLAKMNESVTDKTELTDDEILAISMDNTYKLIISNYAVSYTHLTLPTICSV